MDDKQCPRHLLNHPEGTGDLEPVEPGFRLLNAMLKEKELREVGKLRGLSGLCGRLTERKRGLPVQRLLNGIDATSYQRTACAGKPYRLKGNIILNHMFN